MNEENMPKRKKHIRLRDGRWLCYAEYGYPAGKPVIYTHGAPGSRLCRYPDESIARSLNARIIVPDRPGYGFSEYQPGRKLLDWTNDLLQLVDALKIEKFAIYGFGSGGPYTLACAFKIPQRLTNIGVVNCLCPPDWVGSYKDMVAANRLGHMLARRMPWPLWSTIVWVYFRNAHRNSENYFDRMVEKLPEFDKKVITRFDLKEMMIDNCREAFRFGTRGYGRDAFLIVRPWNFQIEEITKEIYIWYGEDNTRIPLYFGKYLEQAIPKCNATFFPKEGHYILHTHWGEILAALVS
jgi:pimeloyl-ACP methyl ester carboxylesterase